MNEALAPESPPLQRDKRDTFHHGDLRRALLESAWELVEERGAAMTSLREVARRNGVAASSALHHFGDKATLLAAVAEEGFRLLTKTMVDATADVTDKKEHLRRFFRGYVQFAMTHPAIFNLMHSSLITPYSNYPRLLDTSVNTFRTTKEVMRAYLEPFGTPTRLGRDAWAFWSAAHGMASLLISFPPGERPTRVEESELVSGLLETVLLGLAEQCRRDSANQPA
ncbi:TetR/AcrR family transcriptional regulator [Noviherbaspirillum sp.]|uniref:TetR/AcrR family transcriptional regulator n=1 Tax=Noviherbaspirillum sp. TaxID=1926288 RepID=UPI002FE3E8C8